MKKQKISLGISMMINPEFLRASYPLFEESLIEVLEWSFDTKNGYEEPTWLSGLLDEFSNHNKLIGHGVYYSLFDAGWDTRQENWLQELKKEVKKRSYNHITEHFGFMNNRNYHKGVPLPISLNDNTLKIGIDRLKRLQEASQLPVGVENLALSFSLKDVKEQGEFIESMIDPVGGFIILDLHNIYCQAHNFDEDMMKIIDSYPLEKVKEIHISGGSWQDSIYHKDKKIRRDTHDSKVPKLIFNILPEVISKCDYLEYIILERLGDTFIDSHSYKDYNEDYKRLYSIVQDAPLKESKSWTKQYTLNKTPLIDKKLLMEQKELASILLKKSNLDTIKNQSFTNWEVANWDIEMINTAMEIALKWENK